MCALKSAGLLGAMLVCGSGAFAGGIQATTVGECIDGAKVFFATWQSASMTCSFENLYLDSVDDQWKVGGFGSAEWAWSDTGWRTLERSMSASGEMRDELRAEVREAVTVGESLLMVYGEFRAPTVDEYDRRDLSWVDFAKESMPEGLSVSWIDEPEERERSKRIHDPSDVSLLTGRLILRSTGQMSVLDDFEPLASCEISKTRLLDRDCFEIVRRTQHGGEYSIVLCPELGFAPLRVARKLTASDSLPGGKTVGAGAGQSGKTVVMSFGETVIEEMANDWSSVTIRQRGWSTMKGGAKDGFGKLYHITGLTRPASDASIRLHTVIPDGTPVDLHGKTQLKAEWRDGKVQRVYDGEVVKTLASVEMAPAEKSSWRWLLPVVVLVAGWTFWRSKRHKKNSFPTGRQA